MAATEDASQSMGVTFDSNGTTNPYPEAILQQSGKSNKLYSSLQGTTPQFITAAPTIPTTRWHGSHLEAAQRRILEKWLGQTAGLKQAQSSVYAAPIGRANRLFAWASSDAYVESKRLQLRLQRGKRKESESEDS
ncbi:uncharacterized protein LODBEIA_P56970 [Lodderomyces beijingensis]|uniref:Uncharacterized protein n=1 Tax=Lodderomyces beijingensis TaxID=1775926 RepID=A0ABP0ZFD4_9ASCO